MTITIAILLAAPIILISIFDKINCFRRHHDHTIYEHLFDIFMYIILITSAFFSYCAFNINIIYGIAHYFFPFVFSILILLEDLMPEKAISQRMRKTFIPLIAIVVIMFVFIIPFAVLPNIQASEPEFPSAAKDITIEPIIVNLNDIIKSVESLEMQLMNESKNIESLSQALISEIEERNFELQQIYRDLEYYRNLASLSKEQIDAIIVLLRREKYIDYLVGFLLGLFTSGIFYLTQRGAWKKSHTHIPHSSK